MKTRHIYVHTEATVRLIDRSVDPVVTPYQIQLYIDDVGNTLYLNVHNLANAEDIFERMATWIGSIR